MIPPAPPDTHYRQLGRITSAFAILDIQIGMVGHAARTGEPWTEDWRRVAGTVGMATRLCEAAVTLVSPELADEISQLLRDAEGVRAIRHNLAHGVFVLDPKTELDSHPWLLRTARNAEVPLVTEAEGDRLVREINTLSRRASELRVRVADYLRTQRRA